MGVAITSVRLHHDVQPGKDSIADALSRLLVGRTKTRNDASDNMADEYIRFVAQRATPKAMSTRSVEEESDIDDELISVRQCIRTGDWSDKKCTRYLSVKDELAALGKLDQVGHAVIASEKGD